MKEASRIAAKEWGVTEKQVYDLVRTGRITRETALAAARSPEELQRWLKD